MSKYAEARSAGAIAASEEILRLGLDESRQIDIFGVISAEQLWLVFQPLGNLLGAYRRTPENAGILITTNRQLPIQRLTGAHEYGHHVLGHMSSVDDEEDIEPKSSSRPLYEIQAETFALNFLMPPRLVFRLWSHHQYPSNPSKVTREQIYRMSLDMGSSYKSTIVQLAAVGKITKGLAHQYIQVPPQTIKKGLGRGVGPANSRAQIWTLSDADHDKEICPNLDDEISLALPENPSTGYRWSVIVNPSSYGGTNSSAILRLLSDEYEPSLPDLFDESTGAGGTRFIRFAIQQQGELILQAELTRPWLREHAPIRLCRVAIHVARHPTDGGQGPARILVQKAFSLHGS